MVFFGKRKKGDTAPETAGVGMGGKRQGPVKRLRENKPWCFWGIMVSFACAAVFSSFYGVFRSGAEKYMEEPLESEGNISWLYQTCYLLYRDLCNAQSREQLDYVDVYLEAEEGYEWILDEARLQEYKTLLENTYGESWDDEMQSGESSDETPENPEDSGSGAGDRSFGGDFPTLDWDECNGIQSNINTLNAYFDDLEKSFQSLNSNYSYIIRDDKTGRYITNMSHEDMDMLSSDQYFMLSFSFDDAGNVTIGQAFCGEDKNQVRKLANGAVREENLQEIISSNMSAFKSYIRVKQPVDCTVAFAVPYSEKAGIFDENMFVSVSRANSGYFSYRLTFGIGSYINQAYVEEGVGGILFLAMLFVALLGAFLPAPGRTEPWKDDRMCAVSFEFLFLLGCALCGIAGGWIMDIISSVSSGRAGGVFAEALGENTEFLPMLFNLLVLTGFFFCWWYIGVCARALVKYGPWGYIRRRSLIYRFFPFIKSKAADVYEAAAHMDLTKNAHKAIIKLLLGNAVILFIISSLWIGGFAITLVYSIVLYLILRKYISQVQKRYVILLKAVDEIAEGRLNVTINEDLGVFEPFRTQVFKIQDGLRKAVDVEVKSQRMKAELVTNMSHDLKTPLTAIITYVNLLKEKDITPAQRMEYLDTLERKSLRLKSLIEDLFEFSKANSDNIVLNIMDVDIMNLLKQVAFEMSDKISASGLDVRMNLTEEKVILPLDSQKTYRIYENLFGNIAKYALPGTRVYVNGFRIDDMVVITLKNISAQEITVDPNELTERFVRGDSSRNTEGSGLGLAIAKSFTELQGGQLFLEVDGDLFKVTTTWRLDP